MSRDTRLRLIERAVTAAQAAGKMMVGVFAHTMENLMGIVMVKCPATGRAIPTGLQAERSEFETATVFFSRVLCPICNTHHEWFAKDAWVRELGRRFRPSRAGKTAAQSCRR